MTPVRFHLLTSELEQVGLRQLKNELSGVLDRTVRQGRPALVTNHNRPDAVLVPPAIYEQLVAGQEAADQLRAAVPMLLSAVAAGVAIPSESLEALGLEPPTFDWRSLNAFQARYPVQITHDEDGGPLPPATDRLSHVPIEADDEELELG